MQPIEFYIKKWRDKFNELLSKGEEWRMRVTLEEFTEEIEKLRQLLNQARQQGTFNEEWIRHTEQAKISVLLMEKVTYDEALEQAQRRNAANEQRKREEAPMVCQYIKKLQVPLRFDDVVAIYNALLKSQITWDDIDDFVLAEFMQTRQYRSVVKRLPRTQQKPGC